MSSRLLHARQVIVVSDGGVDYYPVGRRTQILAVLSVVGFVSWASYSTGSYMAAQSQIADKDREIESAELENQKMGEEFALLRRDLMKMQENDGKSEMSEYTQFVIDQYENDEMAGIRSLAYNSVVGNDQSRVFERMNFLEKQVDSLKKNEEEFVDALHRRAKGKVKILQGIIQSTGLNRQVLEHKQARKSKKRNKDVFDKKYAVGKNTDDKPSGGPFIPADSKELHKKKQSALKSFEKLVLLREVLDRLPLSRPMDGARLTSGFGRRVDPINRGAAMHSGQDFAGPVGSRVRSGGNGKVIYARRKGAYGNTIEIDHGFGLVSRYAHLSAIRVKEGQWVSKRSVIGVQGTTGRSTGHHLHYEVRYNNNPLNPRRFINAGQKYVQAQKK